ncbi:MAG: ABC transporter ATP-binding protein [Clostridiales bacterium]|nr:ABC transporter ATP-binding protein [Clostridiales bacterium]
MISVKNLNKTFKVYERKSGPLSAVRALIKPEHKIVRALSDVSFEVQKGEIVGYIGPNGAGKSTTVKILSGILVPDSGEVTVGGLVPWKDRKKHVKRIGVVFGQRSQLWWDVPVSDSFELLKEIYRIDENEYNHTYSMLAELLNLESFLKTPVRQLSLGQRIRCEIAASLLHNPEILFLDEPTIGLDAVSKLAVRTFIKKINKENDVTVILTTHDTGDIEALAERILLIGKGSILYDGNFKELKNKYAKERRMKIHFFETCKDIPSIEGITSYNSDGIMAEIRFNPDIIPASKVINEMSSRFPVQDLEIEPVEAEEMIAQLYREYKI